MTRFGPLVAAATLVASPQALAERPRPTYVMANPDMVDIAAPVANGGVNSNVIYLNRCAATGDCTFTPGNEDSVSNHSSIIRQTSTLAAFDAGDTAWAAVVECVQKAYRPFGVIVTDEDPSPASHFEAVVAGQPDQLGFPRNVGGVAPFSCGIINNAVTYSFANIYGGSVPDICWTVAQESAHAFGLDHEFLCPDPMTYLTSCGPEKWFRNVDAQCGEDQARPCMCPGVATQNSVARIRAIFGPGTPTPPTIAIAQPQDGASVGKGFVVSANASDDIEVGRVELWVNDQLIGTVDHAPYTFSVPSTLADGVQRVEVRAFDIYEAQSTAEIQVVQGRPCQSAQECPDDDTCVDGRCVLGPGAPGGLGSTCAANEDCASRQCGSDGTASYCAEKCDLGAGGCPDDFGCRKAGDHGVCWPGYDDSGGGCRTAAGGGQLAPTIALGLVAVLLARRRRRRG